MKRKVRFTPSAERRFLRAIAYVQEENPRAAFAFRQKCERVLRRLELFPESGRRIPEFPELPHREVVVPAYRFFYRVDGSVVWVVAVWHSAQQPESLT